jgi:hypothetical protein
LIYRYGERTLLAVAGHGLVVEPAYRTASLTLLASFFRQKAVDLYLTTTAIAPVAKLAAAFKARRIPQSDYETVLFWVLQPSLFTQAMLDGMDLKPSLVPIVRTVASAMVGTDKLLRRRWPKMGGSSLSVSEISVNSINDDFQALWATKLSEKIRLMADRSPAVVQWHFQIPGDQRSTRVFCCRSGGELAGYMIVRSDSPATDGLRKTIIADALIRDDDAAVTQALFVAAYEHAKNSGSHVLEVLGFPPSIREASALWRPYERRYASCPFQFKAADPGLQQELANPAAWYATPFDGDTTLMP